MKKNKTALETRFWADFAVGNPFKALDAFFDFAALDYYKQNLTEVALYSCKTEVYQQDNPSDAFVFYTAFSSFVKICYGLQQKSKKWKVTASLHSQTAFHLSSLTKEEYENPFIVFQKAFNEKTPQQFEFFLSLILELSLSPNAENPNADLTTPYIHLIKMLDAIELIRERGVEKIKKKHQIVSVTE
ncbi:hypothetical protein [Flavobacterium reichenbachii]|uniref:Uncharacterized protein n=1 Tax=Flavobacterium reichenbachii TaxID=362418 RepID=A0A085ZEP6_9FLAO|nr:hypothetical protein [Flavobacterium reichenbachii]KFF02910.1 hypothetical protein IW19_22395 [Flavobacterium reichenbachii]OXB16901.1 hypothetical protein B0A68_05575 [Flavobacterium reichenbachii]